MAARNVRALRHAHETVSYRRSTAAQLRQKRSHSYYMLDVSKGMNNAARSPGSGVARKYLEQDLTYRTQQSPNKPALLYHPVYRPRAYDSKL